MPKSEEEKTKAILKSREGIRGWFKSNSDRYRKQLEAFYGEATSKKIEFVEGFEISPYGRMPDLKELEDIFSKEACFSLGK